MKTVVCDSPGNLRVVDASPPVPPADHALVQIHRVGVCGTDLHAFRGTQPFFSYPRVLGHELAATIVETPQNEQGLVAGQPVVVVPYLACGRCVACRRQRPNCCVRVQVLGVHVDGGMRERLAVPVKALVHAGGLDFDRMALVECLSIGAHAVRRAAVEPGETVLVIGLGPIGLGIAQFARLRGARVMGMDLAPARLAFFERELDGDHAVHGGDRALGEIRRLTDSDLATAVFDATGDAESMSQAVQYVAHGGRLVFVGLTKKSVSFPHPEFHQRETTLLASRNATRDDFEQVIRSLVDGTIRASCMVTHRTGLDGVVDRLPRWAGPDSGVIKALVDVAG